MSSSSSFPPYPSPTKRWHSTAQACTSPSLPGLSARGKTVLVTGGGSTGIGGATARAFAEAGAARVFLLGRREAPLMDNKAWIEARFPGVEVRAVRADVTVREDVEAAFAQLFGGEEGEEGEEEEEGGGRHRRQLDVLIHAAAHIGPKDTVERAADPGAWLATVEANVRGAFFVSRAFARHARRPGPGGAGAVAVAINSWGAHWSTNELFSAYSVAKMACFRLWDTVARARPDQGLRVFHTQPGVVLTEMNLATGGAASFEGVPIDDVSLPAGFNLWLASDEARFLKNKFLWCNWDIQELKARAEELQSGAELSIGLVGWPFE